MSVTPDSIVERSTTQVVDAVIVGAGFSGLYMMHRLREELGMNVVGFEAGSGVGGTWHWNRYPGAQTDSLFSIYQFTFSPELAAEWNFSRRYPSQPEVLEYLNFVADRLDLRRNFTFNTRVESADWDEAAQQWVVALDGGEVIRSQFLITAVGLLSAPNKPQFKNLDSFEGEVYHSALWPHEEVDLMGKRIALIGTGSTGIQILPKVAEVAENVTVFQRTPNYVVPAHNRELTEDDIAEFRKHREEIAQQIREHPFAMPFVSTGKNALEVDEAERKSIYEEAWQKGGFYYLFETFDDLQINMEANETACEFIREKIREIVKDPETAEMLTPRNYPYGAKRPPAGTHYYQTFNRPNVDLVDLQKDPILEVTPKGLLTESGEFEFDVIILATGFDASTGSLTRIDIRGRNDEELASKWADGPVSNYGFNTSGFPNLLMITGPLSPFANIPTCIEETTDWIFDCIEFMRTNGYSQVESEPAAEQAWAEHVSEVASMSAAGKGAAVNTWFAGANIDGKPKVVNVYFGGSNAYFEIIRRVKDEGYTGFTFK